MTHIYDTYITHIDTLHIKYSPVHIQKISGTFVDAFSSPLKSILVEAQNQTPLAKFLQSLTWISIQLPEFFLRGYSLDLECYSIGYSIGYHLLLFHFAFQAKVSWVTLVHPVLSYVIVLTTMNLACLLQHMLPIMMFYLPWS